ncbi:DNA-binding transcriptional regulator, MerR family [Gracilibacillus orientalis]|uniref:DNA-binding transcriptional regulator, MerR family n=1 Tax=Gracilibacillus orientalis TaxID=334253 RepID=A0A1I4IWU3_9BACI|nr:MerR family transcriptional regulator [Gracilibacillus orientalis]SFL58321.1 DNA-binding transcriptional regulator, MerR family [Gracilibacillus orientalis]
MRPIDIARKLNITTSTLRHYETWGIVPQTERKENGFRIYTEEHVAYFECIRAMNTGFGMGFVKEIMPLIHEKKFTEVLWLVNEKQAELRKEKEKTEKVIEVLKLEDPEKVPLKKQKNSYTIGEVAVALDLPTTVLRHWEKEGLIEPKRDEENGYRSYSKKDISKLLIIRTLRKAYFSIQIIREMIKEFDNNNITKAKKVAKDSIIYMDYLVEEQLKGLYYLYKLFKQLNKT